jgi:hypothetical protein
VTLRSCCADKASSSLDDGGWRVEDEGMERMQGQQRTYETPRLEVVGSIADVTGGNTLGRNGDNFFCFGPSAG